MVLVFPIREVFMMNNKMRKILSVICAIGSAITCLVMIYYEIVNNHVPVYVWFVFSVFMFAYVALTRMEAKAKQDSSDKDK